DGTFGAGGYATAILEAGGDVIAIDRDARAIADGQALVARFSPRLTLVEGRFSALDAIARSRGHAAVEGVVLDIGVSSMQIDEAERGFSFAKDGPLDMRMEGPDGDGPSAADIVNRAEHGELTRIIGILGEEKQAARLARAIVARRAEQPFETTLDLARLIERVVGRKPAERIHPATRTFQALRIFVNRELDELADALVAAEAILADGGRLVVVTFHSLEDRIVKRFLASRAQAPGGSRHLPPIEAAEPTFRLPGRAMIAASEAEAKANPRARSAKLRHAVRTAAMARGDRSFHAMPVLAGLAKFQPGGGHVPNA
ncbi:MAG: 16S rRNA (cytosine(1402)-N(4))-methyltransferase RsmH, partial [Pseudomonadota bacterium]|nr:16S rRNA (cytosine(1402)-N(4))-methyltransferase RsmH [Pseudomonadota bacterium]